MSFLAGEDGLMIHVGMDVCAEPIDPLDGRVQAEMDRIAELSLEERGVEYHDIGRKCFELCGAENVVHLDPVVSMNQCLGVRVRRAALVASGVFIDGIKEGFEEAFEEVTA